MNVNSWLIHSVTKKSRTGDGAKGDPTFGSASTIKARVEKRSRRVVNSAGVEVASEFQMATNDLTVALSDVFWFPSIESEPADSTSTQNAARSPVAVQRATTKNGQRPFVMVWF